mmetsp:Transcript_4620/g.11310  ORF Transcript_4620/g.11310 Transcript_4620/m.11310 type:complete len:613 (-) Transcript_4620:1769-3607(-)
MRPRRLGSFRAPARRTSYGGRALPVRKLVLSYKNVVIKKINSLSLFVSAPPGPALVNPTSSTRPSSTSGSEIDADPIPASSSSASANNIREPVQQSQPQSTHTHSTASDQHHRVVLPDEEISRPTTNENRRKMFDARNRPRRPSQLHISAVDDYLLDGATNSVSIAGDNHSTNFSVRGVQEGTPGTFVPAKNVNFSLLNGAGGATGGLLSSGSGTRNSSAFVSTAQSGAAAMQMMTAAASMQASASLTGAGGGTGVNAATSPVFPATHQAAGIALQPQDALRMPKIVSTGTRMISSSSPPAEGAASGTNAAGNSQPLYFYQHVNDSSAAWSSKNSKEGSSFSSVAADENKDGSVFTSAAARQLHVSHHQHLSEQALKMEQATTKKYINPYFLQPVETITVSPQEIRINELEQRETELKVEGENFYNEVLHLEAEVDRLKKQKMAEEQEKKRDGCGDFEAETATKSKSRGGCFCCTVQDAERKRLGATGGEQRKAGTHWFSVPSREAAFHRRAFSFCKTRPRAVPVGVEECQGRKAGQLRGFQLQQGLLVPRSHQEQGRREDAVCLVIWRGGGPCHGTPGSKSSSHVPRRLLPISRSLFVVVLQCGRGSRAGN